MKIIVKGKLTKKGNTGLVNDLIAETILGNTKQNIPKENTISELADFLKTATKNSPSLMNDLKSFNDLEIVNVKGLDLNVEAIQDDNWYYPERRKWSFGYTFEVTSIEYELVNTFADNTFLLIHPKTDKMFQYKLPQNFEVFVVRNNKANNLLEDTLV